MQESNLPANVYVNAAGDESKAHAAATEMIATSEKRWGDVKNTCDAEKKDVNDWINNPVVNVEKMTKRRLAAEKKIVSCINEPRRRS